MTLMNFLVTSLIACLIVLGSVLPAAARATSVAAVIRQQTELFTVASQSNDQAAMSRLLDDEVLFSGGSGVVDTQNPDPKRDRNDRVSAVLKKKTLALLASSTHPDGNERQPVDAASLIVTEDGYVSNHRDIASGGSDGLLKKLSPAVTVSDWMMHDLGDAAVTSYVESQVLHLDGQTPRYQSLFVDVWVNRHNAWTLVSSHRIALHQDPPALPVEASALDEYAGEYAAASGVSATITRADTALVLASNGGKPAPLLAEACDVFFRPGRPAGYPRPRIVFQRDAGGRITGYVSRSPGLGNVVFTKSESRTQPDASSVPPATISPGPLTLREFIVHQFGDVAVATFLHDRETKIGSQVAHATYRSSETWIKRGSEWKMISSQGCEIQSDPPSVALAPDVLDGEVGTYRSGPQFSVAIRRDGTRLIASMNGGAVVFPLVAQARDVFFTPGSPLESFIFQRGTDGKVTGCVERYAECDFAFRKA
jgi:hypothetical protein